MGATEDQIDYLMGFPGSNMEFVDYEDQLPTHKVCFEEPFWIDVFEVTQAQFSELEGQSAKGSYFLGDDLPREQLTWLEANAFCEKRGARLPTEA